MKHRFIESIKKSVNIRGRAKTSGQGAEFAWDAIHEDGMDVVRIKGPDEDGSAYVYMMDWTGDIIETRNVTCLLDINSHGQIIGIELLNIPDDLTFGQHPHD